MLNILYGRAGTGKTRHIMLDIKRRMDEGETGMLLIVPEQYSHDAERQLCAVCGDALPLHAEVLSFTRLCRHVFEETGGGGAKMLDRSGQILVMHKALESVMQDLKVFGARRTRTQMLESLLSVVREFKSMCITPEKLEDMASKVSSPLCDKLRDFALIISAYDAIIENYGGSAAQHLTLLASKIGGSTVGSRGHIYFDGFVDFTAQEMRIIEELLKKGADLTVCLTCEIDASKFDPGYAEVFEIPRRAAAQLSHMPGKITYTRIGTPDTEKTPELEFLESHLFDDEVAMYEKCSKNHNSHCGLENDLSQVVCNPPIINEGLRLGGRNDGLTTQFATDPVTVFAAPSRYAQCEYVCAAIWDLVRTKGYRWREIGVVMREFSQHAAVFEQTFDRYGIPYFIGGGVDIQSKPPIALIDAALEITAMGWEYKSVFRYIKTGLVHLTTDEAATLENYVLRWNIRGSLWLRPWAMPPGGYSTKQSSKRESKADATTLEMLNSLRKIITQPLIKLREGIKGETSAEDKLRALYEFLTDISLPETLSSKADDFAKKGQLRTADEYKRLLDIIIGAIDQMYIVLGDGKLSAAEFHKLFSLVLSQYEIGVIPVSLDRVTIGAMAMSRRRDLKCLIIPGATDENMPALVHQSGALSDSERAVLSRFDESISSGLEQRLYREMNMIYSTVTLPSEKLVVMYETSNGQRPSFIVKRLCDMFNIEAKTLKEQEYTSMAEIPYEDYISRAEAKFRGSERRQMSPEAAKALYGSNLALSATRVDNYYSCPHKFFLQSGLGLKPRKRAQFDAAEAGNFMHYVLEGVFSGIIKQGIENVDETVLREHAEKYTDKFVKEVLQDFEGKNTRFRYLFRRYEQGVLFVLKDMIDELKRSKFTPVEFEMDISQLSQTQRGFIDRIDAYQSNGRLYLRIIDYKTRKKAYTFDLRDVLCGRDMQMLIYLFALQKHGEKKFGIKPEPAGVLYLPARDVFLNAPRNANDDEIEKLRHKNMRRSGLVINEPGIIEAMESGESKRFLPVKTSKDGRIEGDSLVSHLQIKTLAEFVENKMSSARDDILRGVNDCKPYYKSINDNACVYCDYRPVCGFDEQLGDKHKYIKKMSTQEVWEAICCAREPVKI